MDNAKNQEPKPKIIIISLLALVIISILWYFNLSYLQDKGTDDRGTFGDMFGAVNALFSGLAFAGIIITIYYQSFELKLQRKELELTRNEMELTRNEFVTQNDTIRIQRFENTFFQMLNLYNNQVESMKLTIESNKYEGKSVFDGFRLELISKLRDELVFINREKIKQFFDFSDKDLETLNTIPLENSLKIYNTIYGRNMNILAHYFRTVYHILKLIHNTSGIDKSFYISIFRAQLSNSEQTLLLYNCLHENGKEKFKPLAEKYSFFQNINLSLLNNNNIINKFDKSAFE